MSENRITPGPWEYDKEDGNIRHATSARTRSNIIAGGVLPHNGEAIAALPGLVRDLERIANYQYRAVRGKAGTVLVEDMETVTRIARVALRKAGLL